MSSRGLTTGSSIKRDKSSFFYLYFLLFYWTPWTSHGMTGENDPRRQYRHGMTQ
ncbi:MAG: palindromic element RPE4 domain-containing protein [Janthinobacterium lividum]